MDFWKNSIINLPQLYLCTSKNIKKIGTPLFHMHFLHTVLLSKLVLGKHNFTWVCGRNPRLPIDLSLLKAKEKYTNANDYRAFMTSRFLDARKLAHDNIELAQQQRKMYYDKNSKETSYEIGQQVWLYSPDTKTGLSSKLTYNCHGPFCILAKRSPVNYLLERNEAQKTRQVVHVNRFKPFISPDVRHSND